MRLIGLALIFVLLVGLTQLVLDRHEVIGNFIASPKGDQPIELVFETPTAPYFETDLSGFEIEDLAPLRQSQYRALKKFPDYTKLAFRLPQSIEVRYAYLSLDLKTRLLPTSSGTLNVRINGEKRGEVLLEPGAKTVHVRIPLEKSDLSEPLVEVALHTFGQSLKMSCSKDEGLGVLIEVLPTTRINAVFSDELGSFADQLVRSGDPARVIWPQDGDSVIQSDLLVLAHNLVADNFVDVMFVAPEAREPRDVEVDDAAIDAAMMAMLPNTRHGLLDHEEAHPSAWPVTVFEDEQDLKVRRFSTENTWNFTYSQAGMPDGMLPGRFDFAMSVSGAAHDEKYLLYVTLNGTLVHSENLPPTVYNIHKSIDLPARYHRLRNVLSISVVRSEVRTHPCNDTLPIVAQLRPGAKLHAAPDRQRSSAGELMSAIGQSVRVEFDGGGGYSARDAGAVLRMLGDVLGPRKLGLSYVSESRDTVSISAVSVAELRADYTRMLRRSEQPIWVVWEEGQDVRLARADATPTVRMLRSGSDELVLLFRQGATGL